MHWSSEEKFIPFLSILYLSVKWILQAPLPLSAGLSNNQSTLVLENFKFFLNVPNFFEKFFEIWEPQTF